MADKGADEKREVSLDAWLTSSNISCEYLREKVAAEVAKPGELLELDAKFIQEIAATGKGMLQQSRFMKAVTDLRAAGGSQDSGQDRVTGGKDANDLEEVIKAGKAAGIIIRRESNGVDDPIHDTKSSSSAVQAQNPHRKKYNDHFKKQLFHSKARRCKVARCVSKEQSAISPLGVIAVWSKQDKLDIARCLLNIQDCILSILNS
jgi:hypothetical protein